MKFNQSIAGYHMLMILSEVDGYFDDSEKTIIEEYIKENFEIPINLETENRVLSTLPKELYMEHFQKVANDFFWDSTPEQRIDFINFAFKLVNADKKLSKEENLYIDALYQQWDLSVEEEI
jgi:uncharacterized tellurite resistance protein B-like protein